MTKVLLISQQLLFRQLLSRFITVEEPKITVEGVANATEALECMDESKPDLIFLHIGYPVTIGMQTLREIQKADGVPVLVLFDSVDDTSMTMAIQTGVVGCLDASVDITRLIQGVRDAAEGEMALSESLARRLVRMVAGANGSQPSKDIPTPRELDILRLVSIGLTNGEIARQLFLSESTVRTHVRALIQKLGAHNRVALVVRGLTLGIIDTAALHMDTWKDRRKTDDSPGRPRKGRR